MMVFYALASSTLRHSTLPGDIFICGILFIYLFYICAFYKTANKQYN